MGRAVWRNGRWFLVGAKIYKLEILSNFLCNNKMDESYMCLSFSLVVLISPVLFMHWTALNLKDVFFFHITYFVTSNEDRSTTALPIGSSLPTRSKSNTLRTSGNVMSSIGTQNFSFHWGFKFFETVRLLYTCFPSDLNLTYGSLVPEKTRIGN